MFRRRKGKSGCLLGRHVMRIDKNGQIKVFAHFWGYEYDRANYRGLDNCCDLQIGPKAIRSFRNWLRRAGTTNTGSDKAGSGDLAEREDRKLDKGVLNN